MGQDARVLVLTCSVLLLAALAALPGLSTGAGAAGSLDPRSHPPKSRLSGGLLTARAVHAGQVQPISAAATTTSGTPTCSPTPCALPNVQVSSGKKPVNEDPIAANPINAQGLLTGGNDYNCNSLLGFFASSNGGSSWNHTCMTMPATFPVGCGDPGVSQTLAEHWNGTNWSVISSPNVGTLSNSLKAVAAVSASDIWAVGNTFNTVYSNFETLAEHWNGTSWTVVPSLSDGTGTVGNDLLGVTVVATNNLWTAGYEINSGSVSQTLIEQYCC